MKLKKKKRTIIEKEKGKSTWQLRKIHIMKGGVQRSTISIKQMEETKAKNQSNQ